MSDRMKMRIALKKIRDLVEARSITGTLSKEMIVDIADRGLEMTDELTVQKPVAWRTFSILTQQYKFHTKEPEKVPCDPLYLTPQCLSDLVRLTNEEIEKVIQESTDEDGNLDAKTLVKFVEDILATKNK